MAKLAFLIFPLDKSLNLCYTKDTKEERIDTMKTWRLPTNIIVNEIMWARPAVRHLFGKYFWDGDYKTLMIGDKTLKQHRAKYHKVID